MDRKTYTLLITSNRKGGTRSLTVSASWVKAGGFLLGLFFILTAAVSVDYVGLLLKEGENKRLKVANAQLNQQLKVIEGDLTALEAVVKRVKNFETKLKLITNVEEEDDHQLKLAMGTRPKPGEHLPHHHHHGDEPREPASEFMKTDALFLQKPPLDEEGGELNAVKQKNYASLSIRIAKAVREAQLQEVSVINLHEALSDRNARLRATPSIKPARGWYTSRFGYRLDPFTGTPSMHSGLDIAAGKGTPIRAPADGKVTYANYEPGYGNVVAIDHGYGIVTRYAHTSQIFVDVGQRVRRRDVIAAIGSTGRSTSSHLHYEVRVRGVPVDPINYILDD